MTTQRKKDLDYAERIGHGPEEERNEVFARGAAYGRKAAAKRIRQMRSLHTVWYMVCAEFELILRELEANE